MANSSKNFSEDILKLIFQNVSLSGVADGLVSPGTFYIRLCTDATVTDANNVGTETTYGGYVAKGIAINRSVSDWTVTLNEVKNTNQIDFADCTGTPQTIRYVEVWKDNVSTVIADRIAWVQLDFDASITSGKEVKFIADALKFDFT